MDTAARILYFSHIFGALPLFVLLEVIALMRFSGWWKVLPLLPALFVGWVFVDEFTAVLMYWGQMDSSEFRRLLYERWSVASRPTLVACAVLLVLQWIRPPKR